MTDKAAPVLSVRDALQARIGNRLVERYVAEVLDIDLDVSLTDVQRWMQNGPKWDRLLVDAMHLTKQDHTGPS